MLSTTEFLRLLPKAELHCHFIATMRVDTLVELADVHGVPLRTRDPAALLQYDGLPDFLDVFVAANDVLRRPEDIARVAYEGVEDAVAAGNLRYREYFVNPDNFRTLGVDYPTLIDAMIAGLDRAEQEFGVGYRIIVAINRSLSARDAVHLVQEVVAHPRPAVVGVGQDHLTPDLTEDPLRFQDAYDLARRHGLRLSAHVGETMPEPAANVTDAVEALHLDRVDHGYRVVDDPDLLERMRQRGTPFTCAPHSTRELSGWPFTPEHRIARMVRAGLVVTVSTDDPVLFKTDIGREYTEALPAMGLDVGEITRIARAGFESAWCDEEQRTRLLAEFDAVVSERANTSGR